MTYNIHGCVGSDFKKDPDRILSVIESSGADIVSLQEVHNETSRDKSFIEHLHDLPFESKIFDPTLRRRGADYGNVLLSRYPCERVERVDLSVPKREPRGAITACVSAPHGNVWVIATHLGLGFGERRMQLEKLSATIEAHRENANEGDLRILMGDINEWRDWGWPVRLCHRLYDPARAVRTFPSRFPIFALDRLWLSPSSRLQAAYALKTPLSRKASDHLPLMVEIADPTS